MLDVLALELIFKSIPLKEILRLSVVMHKYSECGNEEVSFAAYNVLCANNTL